MFRTTRFETEAISQPSPIKPGPIPRWQFSNKDLPPSLRFDAWRETIKSIMEISPEKEAGGTADLTAWDLGRLALVRSKVPAASFRRTALQIRNSSIDHWCFTALRAGSFETFGRGRLNRAGPGTLFVKSMHTPLAGTLNPATSLCLFVPRDFCRERVSTLDAADETVFSSGLGRLLADYLINLDRQLSCLQADEMPRVLAATRAMIEVCVSPNADTLAEAKSPIDATLLERARGMVQQNLLSPSLGVNELCRALGVSRSRLYRLFEELGGIVQYIRRRRLLNAHRILASGENNRPIVDIATEHNFLDPADFSRAFKREFGYSPREARPGMPRSKSAPAASARPPGSLADLLLRLH